MQRSKGNQETKNRKQEKQTNQTKKNLGFFGLFVGLFLVSLCFLHALALSLTGAQRTDSNFFGKS